MTWRKHRAQYNSKRFGKASRPQNLVFMAAESTKNKFHSFKIYSACARLCLLWLPKTLQHENLYPIYSGFPMRSEAKKLDHSSHINFVLIVLESNKIDVFSSCFPTHIEISFLLESFPGVNLSALHLRSPLCKPTRNSTHVTFKAPLFGCETRLVETSENYYTFDNVVQGVRPSIKAKCAYPKEHINASRYKENGEYSSK